MRDVLSWAGAAEGSVVVATGLVNAGYFATRARGNRPRRLAAIVLTLLYLGTAALAVELLSGGLGEGPAVVALRAPLVVGNSATLLLIVLGASR